MSSTSRTFPATVDGTIQTEPILPTLLRGTQTGTLRVRTPVQQGLDGSTSLGTFTDNERCIVYIDLWHPDQNNTTLYVAAGDLRALAAAITEHADELDAYLGHPISETPPGEDPTADPTQPTEPTN